jgi:hypothetical protein
VLSHIRRIYKLSDAGPTSSVPPKSCSASIPSIRIHTTLIDIHSCRHAPNNTTTIPTNIPVHPAISLKSHTRRLIHLTMQHRSEYLRVLRQQLVSLDKHHILPYMMLRSMLCCTLLQGGWGIARLFDDVMYMLCMLLGSKSVAGNLPLTTPNPSLPMVLHSVMLPPLMRMSNQCYCLCRAHIPPPPSGVSTTLMPPYHAKTRTSHQHELGSGEAG